MSQRPAGYSGTSLSQKLGIGDGAYVYAIAAPANYRKLLEPIATGVSFVSKLSKDVDVIHLFEDKRSGLERQLALLRKGIRSDAALWVSWPKKAAKVPTDITEDVIRSVALPLGFVDIKVCAVNEVWSGLKLVIRKELR